MPIFTYNVLYTLTIIHTMYYSCCVSIKPIQGKQLDTESSCLICRKKIIYKTTSGVFSGMFNHIQYQDFTCTCFFKITHLVKAKTQLLLSLTTTTTFHFYLYLEIKYLTLQVSRYKTKFFGLVF